LSNLKHRLNYTNLETYQPSFVTQINRKRKRKRSGEKAKFILCIALALLISIPTVIGDIYGNILLQRLNNAHINLKIDPGYIHKAEKLVSNDYFLGQNYLGDVNTENPIMATPKYTGIMTRLTGRLQDLAATYPSITPGIFVWDFETGKYVSINGDKQFATASIIKLPILCQLFRRVELGLVNLNDKLSLEDYYYTAGSGYLQYRPKGSTFDINTLAELMIQTSDNTATNMILSVIGGTNEFNRSLRQWGLSSTYMPTWLPDLTGTNVSTPRELATVLYNVDNPEFLSLQSRTRIVEILSHVKNRSLIRAGLPDNALFLHKTGDIGEMLGDAGIVIMPDGRKYIVVIMVKRPWNSYTAKTFINEASKIIYNSFASNSL